MRIGFVSVWAARGAGYVTKTYLDILKAKNEVFVYARAGETPHATPEWDQRFVTWGKILPNTRINWHHFKKWICSNHIEIVFFNEQRDFRIIYLCRLNLPNIKLGAYIDYYKADMIDKFKFFDFLICNTKKHFSVFSWHEQVYYLPWGTDTRLFKPSNDNGVLIKENEIFFFHSAGLSTRKGTDLLIDTFINTDLCSKSKLIIHIQKSLDYISKKSIVELENHNVTVIIGTIEGAGLYYMGDVYVYPTTLEGLGLTIYEALSSGLPVITTDNSPMNEIVDDSIGSLVTVSQYYSREDGYYWPMSIVDKNDLYSKMHTYISSPQNTIKKKIKARDKAVESLNIYHRSKEIEEIFTNSKFINHPHREVKKVLNKEKRELKVSMRIALEMLLPTVLVNSVNKIALARKKNS
jgi:glycosyltransferase involved in cell wall biosynthesis